MEDVFPINPDLAGIAGRTDLDFDNLLACCFFAFPIYRFPGPQICRFPDRGLSRTWAEMDQARDSWCTAPEQLRKTKLGRSKELGQYHENPTSASPVSGENTHTAKSSQGRYCATGCPNKVLKITHGDIMMTTFDQSI